MILLQVLSALWFPYSSGDSFSTCSMMSLTLVCVPLGDWSLQSLSGLAFLVTLGLWAKSCHQCQRSKISTHVNFSVPAIPVPTQRFSYIHIDIVGPLPSSQGFNYLLTMINPTTWWLRCVLSQLNPAPMLSYLPGSQDLAFLLSSPLTEAQRHAVYLLRLGRRLFFSWYLCMYHVCVPSSKQWHD